VPSNYYRRQGTLIYIERSIVQILS
jgi:hypothetical protein